MIHFDQAFTQTLRECSILVSGQHIPTELVSDAPVGTPYLTGPADFHGSIAKATRYTKHPRITCEANDILITVKGSGCGKVARAAQRSCISRQLMAVQFKTLGDEDEFWFEWLTAKGASLGESSTTGLIPGISREQILSLTVPPIPQDQRHALNRMLRALNERITSEENRISQLDVVKQGLMDDLLTGRVRVPAG